VRARVVASAGLVALLAIALAGCDFVTPNAALKPYDPSDGVSTRIGDVDVLNVMVLSEDGESGNLVFSAYNSGGDDVELTAQYLSGGTKENLSFPLPARELSDFGFAEGEQVFLTSIDAKPGSMLPIYFQYGDRQGRELLVPVLDGSLEQYSPFLPQTPTPTPTPTPTITATPTEEPAP
jgi:hypothetical protein